MDSDECLLRRMQRRSRRRNRETSASLVDVIRRKLGDPELNSPTGRDDKAGTTETRTEPTTETNTNEVIEDSLKEPVRIEESLKEASVHTEIPTETADVEENSQVISGSKTIPTSTTGVQENPQPTSQVPVKLSETREINEKAAEPIESSKNSAQFQGNVSKTEGTSKSATDLQDNYSPKETFDDQENDQEKVHVHGQPTYSVEKNTASDNQNRQHTPIKAKMKSPEKVTKTDADDTDRRAHNETKPNDAKQQDTPSYSGNVDDNSIKSKHRTNDGHKRPDSKHSHSKPNKDVKDEIEIKDGNTTLVLYKVRKVQTNEGNTDSTNTHTNSNEKFDVSGTNSRVGSVLSNTVSQKKESKLNQACPANTQGTLATTDAAMSSYRNNLLSDKNSKLSDDAKTNHFNKSSNDGTVDLHRNMSLELVNELSNDHMTEKSGTISLNQAISDTQCNSNNNGHVQLMTVTNESCLSTSETVPCERKRHDSDTNTKCDGNNMEYNSPTEKPNTKRSLGNGFLVSEDNEKAVEQNPPAKGKQVRYASSTTDASTDGSGDKDQTKSKTTVS